MTETEKILWRDHPSRWQFLGFYLKAVVIVAIVFALALALESQSIIGVFLVVIIFLISVGGGIFAGYIKRSLTTYTVTTQRIRIESGFFVRRREECSLKRIQNTDVSISLLQRLVGIGTVEIDTATDVATHDMRMVGVKNPYAVASYMSANTLDDGEEQGL